MLRNACSASRHEGIQPNDAVDDALALFHQDRQRWRHVDDDQSEKKTIAHRFLSRWLNTPGDGSYGKGQYMLRSLRFLSVRPVCQLAKIELQTKSTKSQIRSPLRILCTLDHQKACGWAISLHVLFWKICQQIRSQSQSKHLSIDQ